MRDLEQGDDEHHRHWRHRAVALSSEWGQCARSRDEARLDDGSVTQVRSLGELGEFEGGSHTRKLSDIHVAVRSFAVWPLWPSHQRWHIEYDLCNANVTLYQPPRKLSMQTTIVRGHNHNKVERGRNALRAGLAIDTGTARLMLWLQSFLTKVRLRMLLRLINPCRKR